MSVVEQYLEALSVDEIRRFRNLSMFPILHAEAQSAVDYILLDDAIDTGVARVSEISESGSVPELKFINDGDKPVLLLDGEELVGAKQNRILNLSVLAPGNKTTIIPVSCVESGRWRHESRLFRSAKRAHYAEGRARKAGHVSYSMRANGTRRSNQAEVWNDIDVKFSRMQSASETSAAEALYQTHSHSIGEYLKAFSPVNAQVGAIFAINGQLVGMDLFDSATTFSKQLEKLIMSYALDAIDQYEAEPAEMGVDTAMGFIRVVAETPAEQFSAVGLGEDVRFNSDSVMGGALTHEGRMVHLMAFQNRGYTNNAEHGRSGRMVRSSLRRRHIIH